MSANRDRLLAMVEQGVITADELNMALVKWCSESDLAEIIDINGWVNEDYILPSEDDECFGPDYRYDYDDECDFADPGGNSALRRAHAGNPRNLPCPCCKQPNRLTPADKARGYRCDTCADKAERGYDMD